MAKFSIVDSEWLGLDQGQTGDKEDGEDNASHLGRQLIDGIQKDRSCLRLGLEFFVAERDRWISRAG